MNKHFFSQTTQLLRLWTNCETGSIAIKKTTSQMSQSLFHIISHRKKPKNVFFRRRSELQNQINSVELWINISSKHEPICCNRGVLINLRLPNTQANPDLCLYAQGLTACYAIYSNIFVSHWIWQRFVRSVSRQTHVKADWRTRYWR